MAYRINWPLKRAMALLAACFGVLVPLFGLAAGPAAAATTSCQQPASAPVFSRFGDTNSYTLVPGGSFEPGAAAWTLNGNAIVAGNEPFMLNSPTDAYSLSILPGKNVVSPAFCVTAANPTMRLVAKKPTKGSLKIEALYTDQKGAAKTADLGSVNYAPAFANWAPSPVLKLGTALPLAYFPNGINIKLRITADTEPGAWQIDDVYVDPYSR